jgi:DNA-binding CsgD family transcriptional regulator
MVGGWPFVGRAAQLEQLAGLTAARTSVLLVGDPGIGKSALAARLAEGLARAGRPVGAVSGQALSGRVPFEAFATLLSSASPADPAEPADGQLTPRRVAEQVHRVLRAAARDDVLLLVDDAHLLDEASVLVLHHLVVDALATLVLTSSAPLQLPEAVRRLVHEGRCRSVEVTGLADADLAVALEQALGAPVEPRTERTFLRRAEGNPLLLRDLLAAAEDAQSLALVDGVWRLVRDAPLARTIRDLVAGRVAELPPDQLAALETVAATEPLPTDVAAGLVGWEVLEALEAARLVAVREELGRSQVSTAHPVYGDAIRADLPRLRLRRLRLAGAEALEGSPDAAAHDLVRAALWRLDSGEHGDVERLLAAARAARSISLDMSERLARAALAAGASVQATVLLAEVLTHARRPDEAASLLAALPPETLPSETRDALVYLGALQQGLLGGDPDSGGRLIAGVLAGETTASNRLLATHASFLAFDARFEESVAVGAGVAGDPAADPESRTIAGMGVVGAHYWLGRGRRAIELADELGPVAESVRDALPYAAPAIELIAICALIDDGDLDAAYLRAQRMGRIAAERDDPFATPRAEYCLARVLLARGRTGSAARLFRRCLSALTPFDLTFARHLHSMLARSEALAGHVTASRAAFDVGDAPPNMPPYEPDWDLAEAALSAAEVHLTEAADQAAYVARVAAARSQWTTALYAGYDAARYGAAGSVLADLRTAAAQTDSALAPLVLRHAEALAEGAGTALDAVARDLAASGHLALAVEAATSAASAHARHGDPRAGRASTATAERLRAECEDLAFPWLADPAGGQPLTARERQVAALAATGRSDAEIATRLGISVRTVQTHLAHTYDKLGIRGRRDLAIALA